MTISVEQVDVVAQRLAAVGLNRCQAVATATLPAEVWLPAAAATRSAGQSRTTLLVVGHAGTALWDHLTDSPSGEPILDPAGDPIDTFSVEATEAAINGQWPDVDRRLLYPHPDCPVDLVALGRSIGWHSTSPLGLGIHPEWGLWSAYRAVWELSAGIARPSSAAGSIADVCRWCETQDCVAACPAEAVVVGRRFDLAACFGYRAEPASECAETCRARSSCPVGVEHRYSTDQMAYHYRISRPAVRSPSRRQVPDRIDHRWAGETDLGRP